VEALVPAREQRSGEGLSGGEREADARKVEARLAAAVSSASCSRSLPSIVGTFVTTVGRYMVNALARLSGVGRSLKSAAVAPTANGNMRFVPVAYPKKRRGTLTVTSSRR